MLCRIPARGQYDHLYLPARTHRTGGCAFQMAGVVAVGVERGHLCDPDVLVCSLISHILNGYMETDQDIIVQAVWKIASGWFNENVVIPITNFFKGLWESVSGFFKSLWEDIVAV